MNETLDQSSTESGSKRYVYCLVNTTNESAINIDANGLDGETLSLIEYNKIGAVVHKCDSLYDSKDENQIKSWLIQHQKVVDRASEAFETPLPVRFDTIIDGDDEVVKDWLSSHEEEVETALRDLHGRCEYRIELLWNDKPFREEVRETDQTLQNIKQRKENSNAGKKFMLEKKYSDHLRKLILEREAELRLQLNEQITSTVVDKEVEEKSDKNEKNEQIDRRSVVNISVLADEADESVLGEQLDMIAEKRGVRIHFTGPWPPYTFAPELG